MPDFVPPPPLPILVVDDSEHDRFFVQDALRKAGVVNSIHCLGGGEAAIDYLLGEGEFQDRARFPLPVLILLDIKMPRKNGFEVLEWLRKQPGLRRLVVVMLSGSFMPHDIERSYDLGANSFLCKPTEHSRLIELMQDVRNYWLVRNRTVPLEGPRHG